MKDDLRRLAIAYRVARSVADSAESRAVAARAALVSAMRGKDSISEDGCRVTHRAARLEPRPDWIEVAISLRDELQIPMVVWIAIVDRCTHERRSQRRISVQLDRVPSKGRTIGVRLKKEGA